MATSNETATYIGDLQASSTVPVDATAGGRSRGGAEIRKTKDIMKATFPSCTGAVTATHTDLNKTDVATDGTVEANKMVVADVNKDVNFETGDITATDITATGTGTIATADINGGAIDGVTIGAAVAATITGAALGTAVTAVTQSAGDDTTAVATTAFVNDNRVILDTAQSASGTEVDFTSIPADVKQIVITYSGVSSNGTSAFQLQLGDSGGIETTGYSSGSTTPNGSVFTVSTTGILATASAAAASAYDGQLILSLLSTSSNTWVAKTGSIHSTNPSSALFGGSGTKSLSATLTQLRFTTVNGTDTFDAGTINIQYQ